MTKQKKCLCKMSDREDGESQREWLKRCWCMYHWMQTDYYQAKLKRIADHLSGIPPDKDEAL